jgi:hypothetical protein
MTGFLRTSGLVFLLVPGLLIAPLPGQGAVQGVVRDSASGEPVALVEVVVRTAGRTTSTDSTGRFRLPLPTGLHLIQFRRIGYATTDLTVTVATSDTVQVEVNLVAVPRELEPVVVEEELPERAWPPGLDSRLRSGRGSFLTEDLLRRSEHQRLSTLLRRIGGIRVVLEPETSRYIVLGRGAGAGCPLAIWLNGVQVYRPSMASTSAFRPGRLPREEQGGPPSVDQWLAGDLEAVEVYSVAETPIQYAVTGGGCGTMLLWTRSR